MTTTDEYVPSDEQVRGRYCDGTYVQTGHTTEGEDFDAWLARVRRDAEAELDSWMTRAYEAEGKLWQAEARIRHLEATAQVLVKEVLDAENARDESRRGKVEAEARIKAVRDLCDDADKRHASVLIVTKVRRALDT